MIRAQPATINAFVALIVGAFLGTHGINQLSQWYSTGQLTLTYGGKGQPLMRKLVAYSDDPLRFVIEFGVDLLLVMTACILCFAFVQAMRRILNDRPEA